MTTLKGYRRKSTDHNSINEGLFFLSKNYLSDYEKKKNFYT